MVYVGIPKDGKDEDHINGRHCFSQRLRARDVGVSMNIFVLLAEALKAIDDGACDSLTRKRVREKNAKPGALWHIYNARDADKIRDLLNKVSRGTCTESRY